MGRLYIVDIPATAVTVAVDLIEIVPADDKTVIVHSFELLQTTDLGDAAEEIIGVQWIRGNSTSGSGGNTPTPAPLIPSDTAMGATIETLNTTQASTGTTALLQKHGWNIRMPLPQVYTPETRPTVTQAQTRMVLRMLAAPADSITVSGHVVLEELG